MNSRVLYIGNQRVDLPDNVNFNLVWQCAEPGELKIYGSGSSTIKLPFTPANDAVFGNCKFLTVIGGREFDTFYDCRYYERGLLMIDGGKAYITSLSDGYEICLTWGNGDLVQKLKDTPLYDKSIGAFKWDTTEVYPMAETSENPKDYPTFYTENNAPFMRLAMNRPIVGYLKVLEVAGITQDTIPANVYDYLSGCYLQVNGTNAIGYYHDAFAVKTPEGGGPVSAHVNNDDVIYVLSGVRIGSANITSAGSFNIEIAKGYKSESGYELNGMGEQRVPFRSYCLFITDKDYGETLTVGTPGFINNVFSNDNVTAYEPTYRAESDGLKYSLYEEVRPVAIGYVSAEGKGVSLFSCGTDDFGSGLVSLSKRTYYIYIIPKTAVNAYNTSIPITGGYFIQRGFDGYVGVDSTATFKETTVKDSATKIESPDDEILKTDPPDKITMLGYTTAAEIAEDFLTMFPLMCMPDPNTGGERLLYFGFQDVQDNIPDAYDWSPFFVRLTKTKIGNDNLALKNNLRFASYGDYAGFRADGSFNTFSLRETEKDYGTLKKIANYDYLKAFTFRNLYNQTVNTQLAQYPLVKVNEKDGKYSSGGLNSVPSVLFYFPWSNSTRVTTEDRKTVNTVKYPGGQLMNTFNYIINERAPLVGWGAFLNTVNRQKTVTVTLNINPGELMDFDFRRPVYIKQLSVYLFAQKITYKGGGVAELQGIVLPPTANGTPQPIYLTLLDSGNDFLIDSANTYMVE